MLVYIYKGGRNDYLNPGGSCCTYMCDPGTNFFGADCAFMHDSEKFEKLIEFSQMSMMKGFQNYLLKQWCIDQMDLIRLDFDWSYHYEDYGLRQHIGYYKIALKYEERKSGDKVRLVNENMNEMNMKELLELLFIEHMKDYMGRGFSFDKSIL